MSSCYANEYLWSFILLFYVPYPCFEIRLLPFLYYVFLAYIHVPEKLIFRLFCFGFILQIAIFAGQVARYGWIYGKH